VFRVAVFAPSGAPYPMRTIQLRRVLVTGLGAITDLGHNVPDTWSGLKEGRSGIDTI